MPSYFHTIQANQLFNRFCTVKENCRQTCFHCGPGTIRFLKLAMHQYSLELDDLLHLPNVRNLPIPRTRIPEIYDGSTMGTICKRMKKQIIAVCDLEEMVAAYFEWLGKNKKSIRVRCLIDRKIERKLSPTSDDGNFVKLEIPYDEFDVLLSDINEEELATIGTKYSLEHLVPTELPGAPYPVKVLRMAGKRHTKTIRVWCLLDTGSPFSCLTVKTLEMFVGPGNVLDTTICFAVQESQSRVEFRVSKVGSNFEHVNILGADAIVKLNLSIVLSRGGKTFDLVRF